MLFGVVILLFCTLAAATPAAAQEVPPAFRELSDSIAAVTGFPREGGNSIRLFTDGADYLERLYEEAEKAQHFIELEFFIFCNDNVGHRFRDLFIRKAREGVAVCLMVDNGLTPLVPYSFFEEMEKAGVEVRFFVDYNQRLGGLLRDHYHRDHRKIIVIDGRVAFIGGMNPVDKVYHWKDAHIQLEGPAVASVRALFRQAWRERGGKELQDTPPPPPCGDAIVQVMPGVPDSSTRPVSPLQTFIGDILDRAQDYVWIMTPYYWDPPHWILERMNAAVRRGVEVRLLIPAVSDYRFATELNYTARPALLAAGVRIYAYQGRFCHGKMIVSDDSLAGVTSLNFNNRSIIRDYEAGLFLYDSVSVSTCKEFLLAITDLSEEVKEAYVNPFRRRIRAWLRPLNSAL